MQEAKGEKKVIQRVSHLHIDEETRVGIQHLETVTTLDTEIAGFASLISQADRRLNQQSFNMKYSRFIFPSRVIFL